MRKQLPWAGLGLLCVAGCGLFFRAPAPIATIPYLSTDRSSTHDLLLLLPGRGDRASTFADEGIVKIAKGAVPNLDVVAVDATVGYYIHRNLPERLMADVIVPAQKRGYRSIWLSGISMGGIGALLVAQRNPAAVSAVVVVAPFLGDEDVINEIERAGGIRLWTPSAHIDSEDYQRSLWAWLKGCTEHRESCPRIFLGFGSEDRFVRANRILAAALPANQVVVVSGGHTWEPWRQAFAALLPRCLPNDQGFRASASKETLRQWPLPVSESQLSMVSIGPTEGHLHPTPGKGADEGNTRENRDRHWRGVFEGRAAWSRRSGRQVVLRQAPWRARQGSGVSHGRALGERG
jgi:pimeloyl-ACP methyl ester carboxylesterase